MRKREKVIGIGIGRLMSFSNDGGSPIMLSANPLAEAETESTQTKGRLRLSWLDPIEEWSTFCLGEHQRLNSEFFCLFSLKPAAALQFQATAV